FLLTDHYPDDQEQGDNEHDRHQHPGDDDMNRVELGRILTTPRTAPQPDKRPQHGANGLQEIELAAARRLQVLTHASPALSVTAAARPPTSKKVYDKV